MLRLASVWLRSSYKAMTTFFWTPQQNSEKLTVSHHSADHTTPLPTSSATQDFFSLHSILFKIQKAAHSSKCYWNSEEFPAVSRNQLEFNSHLHQNQNMVRSSWLNQPTVTSWDTSSPLLLSCTQLQFLFLIPSSSSLWTHNIHFHLLQLPRGAAHEEAHAQEKPFWNTCICNFPTNTQAELIPPISYLFP